MKKNKKDKEKVISFMDANERKDILNEDKSTSSKSKEANIVKISIIILIIALLSYLGVNYVDQEYTLDRLIDQEMAIEEEIEKTQKEIEKLKDEIARSKTPEFIEKQAREQLKMVKPGERVYIDLEREK